MANKELFKHPTVKQVVFQVRYPNLFFLESKIGEFQIAIMDKFPESALIFRRQLLIADVGPNTQVVDDLKEQQDQSNKIWQFKSPLGYRLNVLGDSLDITSDLHKSYDNPDADHRFRDIIEYVLNPFFDLTKLPIVNRVGLRYIDECPFPAMTTNSFLAHFNSCLSTERFSIEDSTEHKFLAVVKRGKLHLRYGETLHSKQKPPTLILDFDGFALDVPTKSYLDTTDKLHTLISKEYRSTIKEPVLKYMRGKEK